MAESKQRAHPRVSAEGINVSVRTRGGPTTRTERIDNISLGGVFIEMEDPIGFGQEIQLEFTIPKDHTTIRCNGVVIWNSRTRAQQEGYTGPSGIGVRLMDISVSDMRALARFIEMQLSEI